MMTCTIPTLSRKMRRNSIVFQANKELKVKDLAQNSKRKNS